MAKKTANAQIKISGEHAEVSEIPRQHYSGLPKGTIWRKVRRDEGQYTFADSKYNLGQSLAWLFFPKNFPKIIATNTRGNETYSKKINLDEKSQGAIESFYFGGSLGKHYDLVLKSERVKRTMNKLEASGLTVSNHPVNIGFAKNGAPVFFEVHSVDFPEATEFAEKIRDANRRKAALAIIEALREFAPGREYVSTHTNQ
jgi:hypothetical protein